MTTPTAAYHVLIVDDSAEDRFVFKRYLSQSKLPTYEFTETETVEDGLKCLAESVPDCVLLDYMLPDGNGLDFLARAMSGYLPHEIRVVMLTDHGDEDVIVNAMKQGAMGYVSKGRLSSDVLCGTVYKAIKQGELSRELHEQKLEKDRLIIELQEAIAQVDARSQELSEANKRLLEISLTDGLTSVANRRCFDDTLAQEWLRATRDQSPIALLIVDIDHFKAYNDHYGHGRGDDCLKQVAAGLKTVTKRPGDLVARYGGEEFAFILPATDEGGLQFAEKCVETVNALQLPHARSGTEPHITVSVGIAWCIPTQAKSSSELLEEADAALYRAKDAGRNQVQASWQAMESP